MAAYQHISEGDRFFSCQNGSSSVLRCRRTRRPITRNIDNTQWGTPRNATKFRAIVQYDTVVDMALGYTWEIDTWELDPCKSHVQCCTWYTAAYHTVALLGRKNSQRFLFVRVTSPRQPGLRNSLSSQPRIICLAHQRCTPLNAAT